MQSSPTQSRERVKGGTPLRGQGAAPLGFPQINTRKKYAVVTNSIARRGQGRNSLAGSRGSAPWVSPIQSRKGSRTENTAASAVGITSRASRSRNSWSGKRCNRSDGSCRQPPDGSDPVSRYGAIVAVAVILDFFPSRESRFLRGGGGHLEHEFLQMLIVRPAGIIRRQEIAQGRRSDRREGGEVRIVRASRRCAWRSWSCGRSR